MAALQTADYAYLPKRAAIIETIAPITTIQPAIAMIICGISGTDKTP